MNRPLPHILARVRMMKSNKDLLASAIKTTQMGQTGIRAVESLDLRSDLMTALHVQLREYDKFEKSALSLAEKKGWVLDDLHPMVKAMAKATTRTKLSYGNVDSKTAAMMIQGNTRGMIKGLRNLHAWNPVDPEVKSLCQNLLDCEKDNIQQMQGYL